MVGRGNAHLWAIKNYILNSTDQIMSVHFLRKNMVKHKNKNLVTEKGADEK